jgi:formylglycine-generating enzyme
MRFLIFLLLLLFCSDIKNQTSQSCAKKIEGMSCIPEGNFIRGSNSHEKDESPQAEVYVSEFYMDINEVTNSDFQRCLDFGSCKDCLKNKTCNYIGPRYGKPYMGANQPITGISWYTAKEYCVFVGKRLPTEAEWEKASRGTQGDLYPWGNEDATCKLAVIEENRKKGCGIDKDNPTANISSKPIGRYGLYDMAGNSWEWVEDWYIPFKDCGVECEGKNPKGICSGSEICSKSNRKVLKGGSWYWDKYYARGSKRRSHDPKNFPEYHHFGFRCAKS